MKNKRKEIGEIVFPIGLRILFIIALFCLFSIIASAINYTIEAGESIVITLPESYADYNVTGNSSEVGISPNGLNVTISVSKYEDNNFEITFFNEKEEVIVYYKGGSRSIPKNITIPNETKEGPIMPMPTFENETEPLEEVEEEGDGKKGRYLFIIAGGILILISLLILKIFFIKPEPTQNELNTN